MSPKKVLVNKYSIGELKVNINKNYKIKELNEFLEK